MKRGYIPSTQSLLVFEAAARHLSFSNAAQELHLTQGAVSHQIRLLEEQLCVKLFDRVRQRVVLTSAGRFYVTEVGKLLSGLSEATRLTRTHGGPGGALNLAVLPTLATRWLIPRLPDFYAQYPDITINLISRISPFDFSSEELDGAIHYGNPAWVGAIAMYLMGEMTLPVCSPAFRQKFQLHSPKELARVPLLHQTTRPSSWEDWFKMMEIPFMQAHRGSMFEHFSMIIRAAVLGQGVGMLPRFLVEEELADGRLKVPFEAGLPSTHAYYFVYPEGRTYQPSIVAFGQWLQTITRGQTDISIPRQQLG